MTVEAHVTSCEMVTLLPDQQVSPEQQPPLLKQMANRSTHLQSGSFSTPSKTPLQEHPNSSVKSACKHLNDSTSSLNAGSFSGKKHGCKSNVPAIMAQIDSELIAEFVVRSPIGETVIRDIGQQGRLETALHQSVQPSTAVVNLFSPQTLAMKEEYEEEKRRAEQQELIRLEESERKEEQEEMKRLLEQMEMVQLMSSEKKRVDQRRMSQPLAGSAAKSQHRHGADAGVAPKSLVFPDSRPASADTTSEPSASTASAGSTDEASENSLGAPGPSEGGDVASCRWDKQPPPAHSAVQRVGHGGGARGVKERASPMPWPVPPSPVAEESSTAEGEDVEASPQPEPLQLDGCQQPRRGSASSTALARDGGKGAKLPRLRQRLESDGDSEEASP